MDRISLLFDRLDSWRHLPNYQLERRADVFFSLYLAEALEDRFGVAVDPYIISEFPIRIGTIWKKQPDLNKSFKIDYLAISNAKDIAYLVELKTDIGSRREQQDWYLTAAADAGMSNLLTGLIAIFRATTEKRKYFHLLLRLEELSLLTIPTAMKTLMEGYSLVGITELCDQIVVTCPSMKCEVVYLQPIGNASNIITFDQLKVVISRYSDPISKRFAKSLGRWTSIAGE
jgi:hypothetical protein